MESTDTPSSPKYLIVLIIIIGGILGFSVFKLFGGSGELHWFILSVLNACFMYYLNQRFQQRLESVKNMRLLFSAMFLTALLLLAGLWFIQQKKILTPSLLIMVSAALWFTSILLDRKLPGDNSSASS